MDDGCWMTPAVGVVSDISFDYKPNSQSNSVILMDNLTGVSLLQTHFSQNNIDAAKNDGTLTEIVIWKKKKPRPCCAAPAFHYLTRTFQMQQLHFFYNPNLNWKTKEDSIGPLQTPVLNINLSNANRLSPGQFGSSHSPLFKKRFK